MNRRHAIVGLVGRKPFQRPTTQVGDMFNGGLQADLTLRQQPPFVQVVKAYRQFSGQGLRESRDAIDAIVNNNGVLEGAVPDNKVAGFALVLQEWGIPVARVTDGELIALEIHEA